jgi:hypothetical protein
MLEVIIKGEFFFYLALLFYFEAFGDAIEDCHGEFAF